MRDTVLRVALALAITLTTGCSGCDEEGLPSELLELVPAETQAVFVVNLQTLSHDIRRFSPYRRFEARWDALGEALDDVLRERLGVPLFGARRLAGWAVGSDEWAAVIEGDFEGELTAEGTEIGGQRAMEIQRDTFAMVADGRVLVGTQTGLEKTLAVIEGHAPSLSEADDETATLLRELLREVGGEVMAIASTTGDLREQFGAMAPDAQAFAASSSAEQFIVRARMASDDAAESTSAQLRTLLHVALAGLAERSSALREDSNEDFEEIAGALVLEHTARLAVDELLEISVQGADLVIELDLRDLGGGVGVVGALGAVAVPAFFKYMRRAQTAEVDVSLRRIADSASLYYVGYGAFPESVPRTPAEIPCGEVAAGATSPWDQPTWQALEFSAPESSRFSYQFDTSGEGRYATFTASAFGDLDCDGDLSTFTLDTWIDSNGEVSGGDHVVDWNELE